MRNFESFRTEEELLARIDQLRAAGIKDSEMHVIAQRRLESGNLDFTDINELTDYDFEKKDVTLGDRITAFFTGETPEEVAFEKYRFDDTVRGDITSSVRNGNYVLIVDREGFYDNAEFTTGRYDYIDEDIRAREDIDLNDKIKLHEERLRVNKDRVESGAVNIKKDIVTERQEIEVPVEREEVTIERRKVDEVQAGDFDSTIDDGETIRIPLHEERVNVDKENVVTEEVVIKKSIVHGTEKVGADLRKERIDIDENVDTDRVVDSEVVVDTDINPDLRNR